MSIVLSDCLKPPRELVGPAYNRVQAHMIHIFMCYLNLICFQIIKSIKFETLELNNTIISITYYFQCNIGYRVLVYALDLSNMEKSLKQIILCLSLLHVHRKFTTYQT